jgi:hypothetical protein
MTSKISYEKFNADWSLGVSSTPCPMVALCLEHGSTKECNMGLEQKIFYHEIKIKKN